MKITEVSATRHYVQIEVPILKEKKGWEIVVAQIKTDEGITGYGMTGHYLNSAICEFLNKEVPAAILGKDPLETEKIWRILFEKFNIRGLSGVWSSAVSAVDIALWDIKGKYFGQPIFRLLGGYSNSAPAYITFGLLDYNEEELVEAAKQFVEQGYIRLKMVVGIERGNNVERDAKRVSLVREAIGPEIELMIDANHLFDYPHALRLSQMVEHLNISWFEEPIATNDSQQLSLLRKRTSIPIAAGQNEGHRWRHRELLVNQSVDYIQPNVTNVGGFSEALKVAHMAQAFNVKVVNGGGWPHHNMHLIAAIANGYRVEFHLIIWKSINILCENPPQPNKGWIEIPENPGLGFEPSKHILKETLIT